MHSQKGIIVIFCNKFGTMEDASLTDHQFKEKVNSS